MTRSLRLLHVVPTYWPALRYGGPIHSVHGLCKALAARGHEVQVFTTNVDGPGDSDVPLDRPVDLDGVQVRYFPSKRLRRLYWSPPMQHALRRELPGFDRVHLHSVFLWPTRAAARVAREHGIPYVLSPRGMLVKELIRRRSRWTKTAWIALIERRTVQQAACLHLTSELEAEELRRFGWRLPPLAVIPNGVEGINVTTSPFEKGPHSIIPPFEKGGLGGIFPPWKRRNASKIPRAADHPDPTLPKGGERDEYALILGRISWKKGIDRALRALALTPEIHLIVAGNDDERYLPELRRLAAELGVTTRVAFRGPVAGADKTELMRQARFLLLPSYSENFGNVVVEAMQQGCPVIVTPEVGAAAIVREAGAGLVLADGEPQRIAEAMRMLWTEADRAAGMGRRGADYVAARLTWPAVAERVEAMYRDVDSAAR